MRNLVLQTSGAATEQVYIGLLLLLCIGFALAYIIVTKDDANLTNEQRTVRDQVRAALDEPGQTVRLDADAIRNGGVTRSDLEMRLRDAFETDEGEAPETAGEAARDIREAIGSAWSDATDAIPKHVLALGEWALLVAVFGTVAVASGAIVTALGWSAGRMSPSTFLNEVTTTTQSALELAIDAAMLFPYSDFLWAMGFANAILLADVVYHNPWLLAGVMVLVAVVLYTVEQTGGSDVPEPTLVRKTIVAAAVGASIIVWSVGAGTAFLLAPVFQAVGAGWLADVVGLLLALAVFAVFARLFVWEVRGRIRYIARGIPADRATVTAILTGRVTASLLRPVAIIAVAAYLLNSIVHGHLGAVINAALEAAIEVQLAILGIVALVAAAVAWEVREAWPQVRQAVTELQARERARASAAISSAPYFGVAFTFIAAWAYHLPLFLGVIAAIIAGVAFRLAVRLYHKARRRHAEDSDTILPVGSLLASVRTIDTVAGERYTCTIGGTLYAHTHRAALLETAVDVLQAKAWGNDPNPTVEEWYGRNLREFGLADYSETYDPTDNSGKLPERARKRILTALRDSDNRKIHRDTLVEDECEDIPDEIVRQRLAEMLTTPGLRLHGDGIVRLKKDIWADLVDDGHRREEKQILDAI